MTIQITMRVSDLIEKLAQLPADRIIVLARDAEGNGFGPLTDVSMLGAYRGTEWISESEHVEYAGAMAEGAEEAVCLWMA